MKTVTEQLAEALLACLDELTNVDASLIERQEAARVGFDALGRYHADLRALLAEAGKERREQGERVRDGK